MVEAGNEGGLYGPWPASLLRRPTRPTPKSALIVTTVFIVADVRLYREGLVHALSETDEIEVSGAADSIEDALNSIATLAPDAVLLDVSTPGSLDAVEEMVATFPGSRVVALSISDGEHDVLPFAEAGVSGYVTRDAGVHELVAALEGAVRGDVLCNPRIAGALLRRVATLAASGGGVRPAPTLTSRELEIVELIDHGLSNKEIAGRLHIEVATVKNHVHNILEKLQVRRRMDAAALLRPHRRRWVHTAKD